MPMSRRVILIDERDNVVTALTDLSAGDTVSIGGCRAQTELRLLNDIPFGHKVAITGIRQDGEVIKYGHPIARAGRDIRAGEHVHVHNAEGTRGRGDLCRTGRRDNG